MTGRAPLASNDLPLEAYRKAQQKYGNIDLAFSTFELRLNSIIAEHLPGSGSTPALIEFMSSWHTNDLYLTTGCAQRTEAAWQRFFHCFKPFIDHIALHVCEESSLAREIAADVLTDLCLCNRSGESRIAGYDGQCSLATWLRAIVTNKAVNEQKSKWSQAESIDNLGTIIDTRQFKRLEADARANEYGGALTDALDAATRALSPQESLLLLLRYEQQLQANEIARREGVHPSTITRRLQQIQARFFNQVVSTLGEKYGLDDAAIKDCLTEISENPSYSIVLSLSPGFPANSRRR